MTSWKWSRRQADDYKQLVELARRLAADHMEEMRIEGVLAEIGVWDQAVPPLIDQEAIRLMHKAIAELDQEED